MSQCDSTFAVQFQMRTPTTAMLASTADSFDFSSEIVVKKKNRFVFMAIRYHLERLRDSSGVVTEVHVVDAKDAESRVIVPLATGDGVVKMCTPRAYAVKYDIRRNKILLKSENKRLLYDFVYDALDAYDRIIGN